MYDDKPYQDFFFTKLFRNLSIASCGYFRLNEKYNSGDYRDLNYGLATFCVLGFGTKKKLWRSVGIHNETIFIPRVQASM
jgi:hypothetical protein